MCCKHLHEQWHEIYDMNVQNGSPILLYLAYEKFRKQYLIILEYNQKLQIMMFKKFYDTSEIL